MVVNNMVSVILPLYNCESFISDAINSVIHQTYTFWELIIIDDCSTDNSLAIAKKYSIKDRRIKCFSTNKPSGSPVHPRNIGIENARGHYIAFLDSDDVWLSDKLQIQLEQFKKDTAIVFSNYEKISEIGERDNRIVEAPSTVNYKQLLLGNVIGCLTAVYDTSKIGKVYFPEISHEDYIVWLSILKKGYIARNTNTVTALYRIRNHSISSNKFKALCWQWNIYVNVEKTGLIKAVYYFVNYGYRAFRKMLK